MSASPTPEPATGDVRDRLARLLVTVILVTLSLLLFAVWQSQQTLNNADDINSSDRLRSRALYLFHTLHAPDADNPQTSTPNRWMNPLMEMDQIRKDLRRRYPTAIADTDPAYDRFSAELRATGTLSWVTADTVYQEAERLTDRIQLEARRRFTFSVLVFGIGIVAFTSALPWGLILVSRVRERQNQLLQENADREEAVHRFASLFANIPAACYSFDRNGKILIWNHAAEVVFGQSAVSVIGRPIWEIVAPNNPQMVKEDIIAPVIQGREQVNLEWEYKTRESTVKSLLSTVFPFRDSESEITGGVCTTIDITDRKQAEERLRSVLEGVHCIVWDAEVRRIPGSVPEINWDLHLWNEEATMKVVPLDLTRRDFWTAWNESRQEYQKQLDAASHNALVSGYPGYSQEFRCFDRYGNLHWLQEDVEIERIDPDNWHIIGICTDITARKQMEQRLDEVLGGARCILWEASVYERSDHDLFWDMNVWNPETARKVVPLDTTHERYETAWDKSRLGEDRERVQAIIQNALLSGESGYSQEFRCRDIDGNIRWLHEDAMIKSQGPGRWEVIGVCREITHRKEAEERLNSVLDKARCILWEATVTEGEEDLDWALEIRNQTSAMEIVPQEISHKTYTQAWIESRYEEDLVFMRVTSREAILGGKPGYSQEFRCRDSDGMTHWLREDSQIQMIEPGRWRIIGVCTDITSRKHAEERMQRLATELSRSNAALQDFASIASHDLKEPLRKIQTFGGMLSRKAGNLSPDAQGYLDRMMTSASRMQSLIDGLLSYSRVTTKGNEFTPTDLNEIVKGVLVDLEVRINDVNATVSVAPLPIVMADALQMRQLFQNLIGNALKFHQTNVACRVDIQSVTESGQHLITVSDNGIGFSQKDSERIFEVFERLDGSEREGTGIGLAICRKIVERHGGTISATGTPGHGATFTVILRQAVV